MTIPQLSEQLVTRHTLFCQTIEGMNKEQFEYAPAGKWTVGQHAKHIHLSIKPLVQAVTLPEFVPYLLFGSAKNGSGSYDNLVGMYLRSLENGGKATGKYVPPAVEFSLKHEIVSGILKTAAIIAERLKKKTEKSADSIVLPHPLIGKITLREMMYFTLYHVDHHHQIVKDLVNKS